MTFNTNSSRFEQSLVYMVAKWYLNATKILAFDIVTDSIEDPEHCVTAAVKYCHNVDFQSHTDEEVVTVRIVEITDAEEVIFEVHGLKTKPRRLLLGAWEGFVYA